MDRIYLDHNATSPLRPQVLAAMADVSGEGFGNPSSLHWAGRAARSALEECRERIASSLRVQARELVFTSGGTEANRLAILGALAAAGSGPHVVASAIEHPSVIDLLRQLEASGAVDVTWVAASAGGVVDPESIAAAVVPRTRLVCLQHANNETGAIQAVGPVASLCRTRGILLHCDAVQSLGKIPVLPAEMGADLVTASSHKIGGPRGVGVLWIRSSSRFETPHRGGPQERGLRPGTENLPGVAGFTKALALATPVDRALRDRLWSGIRARVPEAELNGDPAHLLPNTLNVSFPGVMAEMLLISLDLEGVAASSGSACSSGARQPSHVLRAMGLDEDRIRSAVRFSLGWTNATEDVDRAAEVIGRAVEDLRQAAAPSREAVLRGPAASLRTAGETRPIAPGTRLGSA